MSAIESTSSMEKRMASLEFKVKFLAVLVGLLAMAALGSLWNFTEELRLIANAIAAIVSIMGLFVCLCERAVRVVPE